MEYERVPITAVSTVGQLRKLLSHVPDDEVIFFQVGAQDGSAWNMGCDVGTARGGTTLCMVLSHPELKTLKFGSGDGMKVLDALGRIRWILKELDL